MIAENPPRGYSPLDTWIAQVGRDSALDGSAMSSTAADAAPGHAAAAAAAATAAAAAAVVVVDAASVGAARRGAGASASASASAPPADARTDHRPCCL